MNINPSKIGLLPRIPKEIKIKTKLNDWENVTFGF